MLTDCKSSNQVTSDTELPDWIKQTYCYPATILAWRIREGEDRTVVFDVRLDDGTRKGVVFGLSKLALCSGELDRFIATILQREFTIPEGMDPDFARQMAFNHMVHRRIVLVVIHSPRGQTIVVGAKPAESS